MQTKLLKCIFLIDTTSIWSNGQLHLIIMYFRVLFELIPRFGSYPMILSNLIQYNRIIGRYRLRHGLWRQKEDVLFLLSSKCDPVRNWPSVVANDGVPCANSVEKGDGPRTIIILQKETWAHRRIVNPAVDRTTIFYLVYISHLIFPLPRSLILFHCSLVLCHCDNT